VLGFPFQPNLFIKTALLDGYELSIQFTEGGLIKIQ
jgi:hypothetical protein